MLRLYVFRLDRLTRSGIGGAEVVAEELTRHGCKIITVADGFDMEGSRRRGRLGGHGLG